MNIKKHSKTITLTTLWGLACASFTPVYAGGGFLLSELFANNQAEDHTSWYIGGSVGASYLEPRVLVTGGEVTDSNSVGYKVYAGYSLNEAWAAEVFYADLGNARVDVVTDATDVDYQAYGIGLAYGHRLSDKFKLIGKLGVSALGNQVKEGLAYEQVNAITVYKALGLEYDINKNFSLHIDYDHYDKDYQMLSAGLKYSF